MEAIVAVAALVALGVLALRFGVDSRDGFRGKDQELASYGVSWSDLTRDQGRAGPNRPNRPVATAARRVVGSFLVGLGRRLQGRPDTEVPGDVAGSLGATR